MNANLQHGDGWPFSDKLNYLFENFTKSDGQQYTHEEIQRRTGITTGYISKLRHGKVSNPGYKIVGSLARFFGITPNYFFVADRSKAVSELKESRHLDPITMRASILSPKSRQAVLDMLDHIAILEIIPDGN